MWFWPVPCIYTCRHYHLFFLSIVFSWSLHLPFVIYLNHLFLSGVIITCSTYLHLSPSSSISFISRLQLVPSSALCHLSEATVFNWCDYYLFLVFTPVATIIYQFHLSSSAGPINELFLLICLHLSSLISVICLSFSPVYTCDHHHLSLSSISFSWPNHVSSFSSVHRLSSATSVICLSFSPFYTCYHHHLSFIYFFQLVSLSVLFRLSSSSIVCY